MAEESFHPSKPAIVIGAVGAFVLIGYGAHIVLTDHQWVIGSLCILGAVVIGIPSLQFGFWGRPTVTLSPDGLNLTLPSLFGKPYSSGWIAWGSVRGVSTKRIGSRGGYSKILIEVKSVGSPTLSTLTIPNVAIDVSPAALARKIQTYLDAAKR
jgi:hypothetical protein